MLPRVIQDILRLIQGVALSAAVEKAGHPAIHCSEIRQGYGILSFLFGSGFRLLAFASRTFLDAHSLCLQGILDRLHYLPRQFHRFCGFIRVYLRYIAGITDFHPIGIKDGNFVQGLGQRWVRGGDKAKEQPQVVGLGELDLLPGQEGLKYFSAACWQWKPMVEKKEVPKDKRAFAAFRSSSALASH